MQLRNSLLLQPCMLADGEYASRAVRRGRVPDVMPTNLYVALAPRDCPARVFAETALPARYAEVGRLVSSGKHQAGNGLLEVGHSLPRESARQATLSSVAISAFQRQCSSSGQGRSLSRIATRYLFSRPKFSGMNPRIRPAHSSSRKPNICLQSVENLQLAEASHGGHWLY